MLNSKQILFSLAIFLWAFSIEAQNKPSAATPSSANDLFKYTNYTEALKEYQQLLKSDPKNEKYNYRIGYCYLMTNISKAKAVPYLEIASRSEDADPDVLFDLGRAYHVAYRFDDAIKAYTKFKTSGKGSAQNKSRVDKYIQYSYNAKELVKYPLNVTFTNLGKDVNSISADYCPYVPADESFLIYNSRRKETGTPFKNGNFTSVVFISVVKDGKFTKGKPIGTPISSGIGDDEIVGLSSKGDVLLMMYSNNIDFATLNISYSEKAQRFEKTQRLPDAINTGGHEFAGSISPDGNTIYFVSNRPGGYGGGDLYVTKKLPNGNWGPAQNLGPEINTADEEDYPNISPDGKTLFFSSNGRSSMGGFDIFTAAYVDSTNTWKNVKNFGYPVNTPEDDRNLRLSIDGRHGYIAAVREGGLGDLDIYRVDFNDIEQKLALRLGTIASTDTTKKINFSDAFITVTNSETNEVFGNYLANPNTGRYVIILPVGEYVLSVEASGFKPYEEKLIVEEKVSIRQETNKNIVLVPEGKK